MVRACRRLSTSCLLRRPRGCGAESCKGQEARNISTRGEETSGVRATRTCDPRYPANHEGRVGRGTQMASRRRRRPGGAPTAGGNRARGTSRGPTRTGAPRGDPSSTTLCQLSNSLRGRVRIPPSPPRRPVHGPRRRPGCVGDCPLQGSRRSLSLPQRPPALTHPGARPTETLQDTLASLTVYYSSASSSAGRTAQDLVRVRL